MKMMKKSVVVVAVVVVAVSHFFARLLPGTTIVDDGQDSRICQRRLHPELNP